MNGGTGAAIARGAANAFAATRAPGTNPGVTDNGCAPGAAGFSAALGLVEGAGTTVEGAGFGVAVGAEELAGGVGAEEPIDGVGAEELVDGVGVGRFEVGAGG